jgi:3-dehydroquinate dehydratase
MTKIGKRGLESVPAAAAAGTIAGFGVQSYVLGLEGMLRLLSAGR